MTPSRAPLVFTLGVLATFAPLSIDMYLPSLPTIQTDLGVSAADVQLTLSSFLIGFSLGQLFYGPLSDRFGRKPVLLSGVLLYAVTSLLCAITTGIEALILVRFFQAFGCGAGIVLSRAIVRDYFPADETARLVSLMTIITLVGPLLSPIVGGYLLVLAGWRSVFWLLTAIGVVFSLIVMFAIRESHPKEQRQHLDIIGTFKAYLKVLCHKRAFGYIACVAMGSGVMFAYLISAPFIIISLFTVPAVYFGYIHGLVVISLILGVYINSKLVNKRGIDVMIAHGLLVRLLGAILLLLFAVFETGGLIGFIAAVILCIAPNAMIMANVSTALMVIFPNITGTTSAVLGAIAIAIGAVTAAVVGVFHAESIVPAATIIAICSIASVASYWLFVKLRL
jgi:DHA1 family bicyclomycin/chloramphenicol resistance-like MFS transporter